MMFKQLTPQLIAELAAKSEDSLQAKQDGIIASAKKLVANESKPHALITTLRSAATTIETTQEQIGFCRTVTATANEGEPDDVLALIEETMLSGNDSANNMIYFWLEEARKMTAPTSTKAKVFAAFNSRFPGGEITDNGEEIEITAPVGYHFDMNGLHSEVISWIRDYHTKAHAWGEAMEQIKYRALTKCAESTCCEWQQGHCNYWIDAQTELEETELEEITVCVTDEPDLKFTGKALAFARSSADQVRSNYSGSTGQWQELTLYQTAGGKYVCAIKDCTQWQGESDTFRAKVCETLEEVRGFFGSGWLAKELYHNADISDSVNID